MDGKMTAWDVLFFPEKQEEKMDDSLGRGLLALAASWVTSGKSLNILESQLLYL